MSALPGSAAAARDLAGSWLSHLRRDTRGLPIPWINRWGDETVAATRISWDAHIGRPAAFHDDHGNIPDFTRQNMGRERQAMVQGLCQVCGRPTPWSRRNLVISSKTTHAINVAGVGWVGTVAEPWLDDRCAAIATLLCPALIRRRHEDDMTVIPVRRAKDVQLTVSVGVVTLGTLAEPDGAHPDHVTRLRAAAARGPVGLWVRAAPLNPRIRVVESDTGGVDAHAGLNP